MKNDENKDGQPKNDSKPNLSSKETLTKIKGLIIKVIKIAKHKFKDAGGVKGIKSNVLKFIDTIKTGFVSDTGVTGFKGVLSRIKNLWNNGNEGKAFILGTAIVLILIYGNKDPSNTSIADESTLVVTPPAPVANAEANVNWSNLDKNSSSYKFCISFSERYHLISNKDYVANPDSSNKFHSPVIHKSKEDANNWYCLIEETVTSYYKGKSMMSFNQEATFVIDKKSQKFTQHVRL